LAHSHAKPTEKSSHHVIDPDYSQSSYCQGWGPVASTHAGADPGGFRQGLQHGRGEHGRGSWRQWPGNRSQQLRALRPAP